MKSFEEMVAGLVKSGADIISDINPDKAHLWHMATGISGEAGELLDAVKKHVIYGKDLDYENMYEELGDLEFYITAVRQALNVSREDILQGNINKLGKRYANHTYSNDQAQTRADKMEELLVKNKVMYIPAFSASGNISPVNSMHCKIKETMPATCEKCSSYRGTQLDYVNNELMILCK